MLGLRPFWCYFGGKWRAAPHYPAPMHPTIVEPFAGAAVGAGTHYRCSAKAIDFNHLGAWCVDRRGQVIVCENEGATWLPFAPFWEIKACGGSGRTSRSAEAIFYMPGDLGGPIPAFG